MDEKTILLVIGFVSGSLVTFISGYLQTLLSDKRKYHIETEKELRLAYARWFSLQRTAFHRVALLFESMLVEPTTVSSEDWRQPSPGVQEELKEFQTILSNLLQNTAEVSLLETKEDRLRTIKSLDENLNKFYYLLLGTVRTQKAQVKHFIWLDEVVASAAKEQTDNKLEETLKGIRAESHEAYVKSHSDSQDLAKRITELMEKIDIEIREFFHSLEGKV